MNEKELCNILVNDIVKEYNKINPKNKTEIYLTKHSQFFVVEGETSIQTPINLLKLLTPRVKELSKDESDNPINIIDVIVYNKPPTHFLNLKNTFKKQETETITKISGPTTSDRYYGLSLYSDKTYQILLKYISNHIFRKNLCREITIELNYDFLFSSNVDNVDLKLSSDNCIVNLEWLQSLILDLFPFEIDEIINHLKLNEFDFENEIKKTMDYPWFKIDKIGDMILL